jgi:hypothetical protein
MGLDVPIEEASQDKDVDHRDAAYRAPDVCGRAYDDQREDFKATTELKIKNNLLREPLAVRADPQSPRSLVDQQPSAC